VDVNETPQTPPIDAPAPEAPDGIGAWLAKNSLPLLFVAGLLGVLVWKGFNLFDVAVAGFGLGLIIFIHELGHFAAAKWCDVHVETFSIGFGPPLPGCRYQYGETTYMLALFPLGGYVKMVGEGADSEEGEDDPRSFKNKTVGQRMLIISAGVVMNVLLAAGCFVGIYMTHGLERTAGVIGAVDSGSPTWQKGIPAGAVILQLGGAKNPYFDDVMPEVMHSATGQALPLVWEDPSRGGQVHDDLILPRVDKDSMGRPVIGVGPSSRAVLAAAGRRPFPPVKPDSPAANAHPPFENGDRIVGTTDPDHPDQTAPLPRDPRNPSADQADYFVFQHRLQQLAGKEMTVLVRRADQDESAAPVAVRVEPAFHTTTGLRMRMGQVTAVREGSPAARAGVRPREAGREAGDILKQVEVEKSGGGVLRWADAPGTNPKPGVEEKPLDPLKLPDELRQWADVTPGKKTVRLTVLRPEGHKEREQVVLTVDWDESRRYETSALMSESAPLAVEELGLAYRVETVIDDVTDGSPAARANLKKDDVIKEVQYFTNTLTGKADVSSWLEVKPDQWAFIFWRWQNERPDFDTRKINLRVETKDKDTKQTREVSLEAEDDRSWPLVSRGLILDIDQRLQKADTVAEALALGGQRTWRTLTQIYQNLRAMVDRRISFTKNASGPLTIFRVSYAIAGDSYPQFILFLGMISINLAVINFLPIPVLDGGHMVFLLYEKLRGRPAPDQVRYAAAFVGLALIGSLMLFVLYLDVKRWLF
jgi:regulator of sigma E protease